MKIHLLSTSLAVACALMIGAPASAEEMRTEQVHFSAGASDASIKGSITGYDSVLYKVGASAGQKMTVSLSPSNNATYFNVYAPGRGPGDEAIANSSMTDELNRFEGELPETGEYTISVYMMRSAARRNEKSNYTINIAVGGAQAAGSGGDGGDVVVRFAGGTNGGEYEGALEPGESRRYILGAKEGQDLYVRVAHRGGPRTEFQIFNPDKSFLLDMITTDKEYRGQLWQSGDHVVEVINRGGATAEYTVIFGID